MLLFALSLPQTLSHPFTIRMCHDQQTMLNHPGCLMIEKGKNKENKDPGNVKIRDFNSDGKERTLKDKGLKANQKEF